MNLFVCLDKKNNVISLKTFAVYSKAISLVGELLQNKEVIFKDVSIQEKKLLPSCKKVLLKEQDDNALPDFLSPIIDKEDLFYTSISDLKKKIQRVEDSNLFLFGIDLFDEFLPIIDNIYTLVIQDESLKTDKNFSFLQNNLEWKLVNYSEPIYESEEIIYLVHYTKKKKKNNRTTRKIEI